jgi:hypothetical protein
VWANSHDLMDKILNADDVVLPKALITASRQHLDSNWNVL